MSRAISLFSGYSQKENRTTNYCLLVLKMLYEENPKFLAEVLGTLVGEELGERIGVKFRQQERRKSSIPDGLIAQPAFTIYIETKDFDWFYDDQLERHLKELDAEAPGLKVLIALSPLDNDRPERFARVRSLCEREYQRSIAFAQVSFEDLGEALRLEQLPKNLADAVTEFRAYLDEQDLLPSWKAWLDVVSCARSAEKVIREQAYICPATGGNYTHSRCQYFGVYRDKRVDHIALIEAVIDVQDAATAEVLWHNVPGANGAFVARAMDALVKRDNREFPRRVFLLGPVHPTNFIKDSRGGMLASKQYFDIGSLGARDVEALAGALDGKTWSSLRSRRPG